ncbi:ATP-binding protein [Leifsonia kafniensis]|uniref:histidine kinase n=1 Tax=Leifsonia kafniensis TaxID=475957 RepID=A0ABP7K0U5_9MICO
MHTQVLRPPSPSPSPASGRIRTRLSLTRQLLLFQLSLLAIVLVAVTAISLEQTNTSFNSVQQRRMLAVAEYSAANPLLRSILSTNAGLAAPHTIGPSDGLDGVEAANQRLAGPVESLRTTTGVDELLVTTADGRVLASPADPRLLGSTVHPSGPIDTSGADSDGAWAGVAPIGNIDHVVARVPILDNAGHLVGMIIAGRRMPPLSGLLAAAAPNLLTYLGVAGILGAAGSWWLAARVKRQTLGLEPEQIARLAEHREAMLHGIREGVIAVDADGVITLANDSAHALLSLPDDAEGRSIDDVGLDAEAVLALRSHRTLVSDAALVNNGMLLVLNQTTIRPPNSIPEVVTTLRDRTELVTLQRDLGSSKQVTDTLRAQTHEFANRLHTISMLIQLGDADAAVDYIDTVTRDRSELDRDVLTRVLEPSVAALVIAKASLARERGAELTLSPGSALPRVDSLLGADLVTVIGNLVDNALDAVTGAATRVVTLDIRTVGGEPADDDAPVEETPVAETPVSEVHVMVSDSGPGIQPALLGHLFEAGVTSKRPLVGDPSSGGVSRASVDGANHDGAHNDSATHGYGLAIVRLVATRRGGTVDYRHSHGTVFEAVLPALAVTPAPVLPPTLTPPQSRSQSLPEYTRTLALNGTTHA